MMPTLTDDIKTFIVKRLASFDSPSQVVEAVKAAFDVEITRQHVYAYDPRSLQEVSPRWRELHAATREAFLRETAEIGVSHKAVRLRLLDHLVRDAAVRGRANMCAAFLEQAAKECGGYFEHPKRSAPSKTSAS